MKKLVMLLVMLIPSVVLASELNMDKFNKKAVVIEKPNTEPKITVKCIDGYKFVIVKTQNGVAITQMYGSGTGTYPPQPIECR